MRIFKIIFVVALALACLATVATSQTLHPSCDVVAQAVTPAPVMR